MKYKTLFFLIIQIIFISAYILTWQETKKNFDMDIYDIMISTHLKNQNDLTTNIFPRTVPPGLTGEVISTKSLKKMYSMPLNNEDKEHVTRYYYKNPSQFSILNMEFSFSKKNKSWELIFPQSPLL